MSTEPVIPLYVKIEVGHSHLTNALPFYVLLFTKEEQTKQNKPGTDPKTREAVSADRARPGHSAHHAKRW